VCRRWDGTGGSINASSPDELVAHLEEEARQWSRTQAAHLARLK
jgi:hypothetical protein